MLMGNLVRKERSKYTKTRPDRVCAGDAQYAIETQHETYSREMVDAVRSFRVMMGSAVIRNEFREKRMLEVGSLLLKDLREDARMVARILLLDDAPPSSSHHVIRILTTHRRATRRNTHASADWDSAGIMHSSRA